MKKMLCFLMLTGMVFLASAQVADYSFSQANNTYTEISGGTVLGSTTTDDQYFVDPAVPAGSTTITSGVGLPIGFTLTFNGDNYDVFGVHANGWLSLGQSSLTPSVNMNTSSNLAPINATSTAPAVLQNRVVGLGRNLIAQSVSELRYQTVGTAPNRALVVQWKNYKRTSGGAVDTLNFQIRLNETSNIVEVIYGKMKVSSSTTTIQIGLRGQANSDYNNRTTTTDWAATTAGVANNSTMTISATVFPASGLTYIWTPPLANDAGVITINSPASVVSSGLQKVAVTLQNFGTDTLRTATIGWSINGTAQVSHLWVDSIASGATSGPDTIGTYSFTSGNYTIKAWTVNPNGVTDLNNTNDTATKIIYVQGYAALPFNEGFDSTWIDKLDTRDIPSVYWNNTPVTSDSSWRRNDDGTAAAWTSTTGNYTPVGANSTIHSARFHTYDATDGTSGTMDVYLNFTPVGTKFLKFWYINPSGNDSLAIYLSTDGGATFTFLQKYTTSATWVEYTLPLGTSVSPTTILRFKATSDYGNDDIGIDGVYVYLQPANDMADAEWVAPLGGCGLTSTENVTIKITNAGTNPQSNIPVRCSVDGGTTIIGPEIVPGPVNPGDTVSYTFTSTADFSNPGIYHCIFRVGLSGDQNHANDTMSAFISSLGNINTFPFTENFDDPAGTPYFALTAAANAAANFLDTSGVSNSGCAFLTGYTSATGWSGTGTISAAAAYGTYTSHHASLAPACQIDATGLSALRMKFDLKQVYYTQKTYTWLVVIANGTDTLTDIDGNKYFNPVTVSSDPFTTRTYDLSAYAGTIFTLDYKSACKYNSIAGAPGNNNYIDNVIFYIPVDDDAGVTEVISPISSACGSSQDSIIVIIHNFGLDPLTNIPVATHITAPSGNSITLYDTLPGPLAPDASDTLVVWVGSTLGSGTYGIDAYTYLATDTVFYNDTTYYTFTTYPALTVPHLEDFESTTPLAYWTTNFLSGNVHGNTSTVMYRNISFSATTGSALMDGRKIGPLNSRSYLTFDYRIVNSPAGTTGTTLTTDSVFVLISNDCGLGYDTVYVITSSNHVTSASMKHIVLPASAYAGNKVMPGFYVKRGTAGNYFLDIDNVAISNAAVVNLGPDSLICPGENITFYAGNAPTGYTYVYSWSTLAHPSSFATTQSITVDSAATYIAAVDNGFGVVTHDTVIVLYHVVPVVSLGNDTTNCVTYTLDPGTGFNSYTWSTTATTQTINVTSSGTYWVDVTNSSGCASRDSIDVTIIPAPAVDAGPTQTICYVDTLQIISANASNYDSLLWTSSGDGHFNDSTLLSPYYVPGTTDIANGSVDLMLTAYAACGTVNSLLVVTISTSAVAYAGTDETICSGESVQFSATGGTTYSWAPSTGLDDPNIANPLATPAVTTTYTVLVSSTCGTASDNIVITVDNITAPDLGSDPFFCGDGSITIDAGTGYDSYSWSTGDNTQTITVDTNGIGYGVFDYWVDVASGACTASDTITVTFDPCVGTVEYSDISSISIFPNPTTGITNIIVKGFSDADMIIYNMQGAIILSDRINSDSTAINKQLDLNYLPDGIYLIRITDSKSTINKRLIIQ
jgi:hypothetical protein